MTAYEWIQQEEAQAPTESVHCPTRDVFQTRIDRAAAALEVRGWTRDDAALTAAIFGELGNNAFDHNVGQWRDVRGCWFDVRVEANRCIGYIADRGQGIRASLARVRPDLTDDKDALAVALTERVTGRAPERRGNGLKFVLSSLPIVHATRFIVHSGSARLLLEHPTVAADVITHIASTDTVHGTYIELHLQQS